MVFLQKEVLDHWLGLPHHGNNTKLLQHTERIKVEPGFDNLPIDDAIDGDPCYSYLLASGRDALQASTMGTVCRIARHDFIPFRNQIINDEMEIGESGAVHHNKLFEPLWAMNSIRRGVQ